MSAAPLLNILYICTFPDINLVKSGFCVAQEGEDAGKLFPDDLHYGFLDKER